MLSEPPIDPTCIEAQRHRLRCVAALPVWHPLCEEEVITPENASPYPFIALSRWQATNFRVARAFDDNRQRWNVAVECELRSEEHTSELQSLMRISYAVFCLKKKNKKHSN